MMSAFMIESFGLSFVAKDFSKTKLQPEQVAIKGPSP
jgi:hypothetical protein